MRSIFPQPMAKLEPKTRTVLEPLAEFNPSSSSVSSLRSIAISTVSDSQTLVYVGTESGNLLLLSLNPNSPVSSNTLTQKNSTDFDDSKPKSISVVRYVLVSDCSVDSIHVIVHIGKVLVVSGGFIFLVDSLLLQQVKKLSFVKGVSVVARRFRSGESESSNLVGDGIVSLSEFSSTGQRFLQKLGGGIRSNGVKIKESELHRDSNCIFAVVAGKRLILVELVLGGRVGRNDRDIDSIGGSFVILKEIQCVEGVKAMVWLDDSIIVGTSNGYSLYSCVTGQSGLIFLLPDPSSLPCLKLLLKEYKVLLLVDNVGVIVNAQGQPVGGSLVFRHASDSIGEISSYVVVVRNGKMELYHKKSGDCVQIVPFSGEGVGSCVVADEENGSGKLLVVATPSKVICYQKVPSEEQIKDLLRKKNFKGAISLVEELQSEGEMTKEILSFVHAQVGFLLLFDLHFEEAVNHFFLSETMQPSEVFPFIMRDPNRWSLLVPRNRYWGLHPPPAPLENVVDDGLMAIQRAIFLKKAGVETSVDDDFLLNPPSRADLLESAIKNIIRCCLGL
uniref:CNH domain-containing protein n=1 Tax=Davidia involucrata TaxID=16924 RepID=A0A5B6YMY6_DAVIN